MNIRVKINIRIIIVILILLFMSLSIINIYMPVFQFGRHTHKDVNTRQEKNTVSSGEKHDISDDDLVSKQILENLKMKSKSNQVKESEDVCKIVKDKDANVYKTIKVGGRCWMAENLKVGIMISSNISQSDNNFIEKYCYNDNIENCDKFGALYSWDEAMQYNKENIKGICPDGWHIPSDKEFNSLEEFFGLCSGNGEDDNYCSNNLGKFRGKDIDKTLRVGGSSGFNVLLSGCWSSSSRSKKPFNFLNERGTIWTSTSLGEKAIFRSFFADKKGVFSGYYDKIPAVSVRCIKD